METFIKHPEFQKLNVGFALDEGKEITTHSHQVEGLHSYDLFLVCVCVS